LEAAAKDADLEITILRNALHDLTPKTEQKI
jgi:hypothetical protein